MAQDTTRLNKFLALHLGVSRRAADELIENNQVKVDGQLAQLGQQVTVSQHITVDDKLLTTSTDLVYLALHKPLGYVCSRHRQGESPTVYSLLPSSLHDLKLVGRLDKDSSGLLLLTNDGDFAHRMTHPSFHKGKTYEIILNKNLEPAHEEVIETPGVQLEDGLSALHLKKMGENNRKHWRVSMHEGRNRQIRRTFEALGYNVTHLHRIEFGAYQLGTLAAGEYEKTAAKL